MSAKTHKAFCDECGKELDLELYRHVTAICDECTEGRVELVKLKIQEREARKVKKSSLADHWEWLKEWFNKLFL